MQNKSYTAAITNLTFKSSGRILLSIPVFSIEKGKAIGVLGANGSGKSLLAGILAGEIPGKGREAGYGTVFEGELNVDGGVKLVSFREQELVMARERYYDDSEFMDGAKDPGRTVKMFLCGAPPGSASIGSRGFEISGEGEERARELMSRFGLIEKADRGLRFLSTGEFRKALVCRGLFDRPDLLILDDPFSGLDAPSVDELRSALRDLHGELAVLILTGRLSDIPEWTDGLAVLDNGSLSPSECPEEGRRRWIALTEVETGHLAVPDSPDGGIKGSGAGKGAEQSGEILIDMKSVNVSYFDTPILRNINWTVGTGEHWQIAGPNGSGKSTLLSLITGDNPKAYGQNISLFGKKKGTGESVWEIKQKIGFVSGALHMDFVKNQSVLEVLLSGFFDSVGLYDKPDPVQIEKALEWCGRFDLRGSEKTGFGKLSFGLQRSVLIARAVIKGPRLLILDEPCQGLDDAHTDIVLKTADFIASSGISTLLYVSHRKEQRIPSVTSFLTLEPSLMGGFTGKIR